LSIAVRDPRPGAWGLSCLDLSCLDLSCLDLSCLDLSCLDRSYANAATEFLLGDWLGWHRSGEGRTDGE